MNSYKSQVLPSKPLMTAKEVSRYLNIGLYTIYRLAKRGNLRGFKMGKATAAWRFRPADVEVYLQWLEKMTQREISQ